jgi:enoyl-[acyl-carrier-protein] reductase (NADH)
MIGAQRPCVTDSLGRCGEIACKPRAGTGHIARADGKGIIAKIRPTSLIRHLATVEEVANMVVYICSPQASATTGAALRVDGGVVRSIA